MENHEELSSWHNSRYQYQVAVCRSNNYKVRSLEIVLSDEGVPYVSRDKDILCDFKQNIVNHCLAKIQTATVLVTDNN